jgi:hypothetical protein
VVSLEVWGVTHFASGFCFRKREKALRERKESASEKEGGGEGEEGS